MRQGWIIKAGGLEITNWSQHPEQAVVQKRLKNHKVTTSSSLQLLFPLYFYLSRPLLHQLSYRPKEQALPIFTTVRAQQMYEQCVSHSMVPPPYISSRAQISVRPEVYSAQG